MDVWDIRDKGVFEQACPRFQAHPASFSTTPDRKAQRVEAAYSREQFYQFKIGNSRSDILFVFIKFS